MKIFISILIQALIGCPVFASLNNQAMGRHQILEFDLHDGKVDFLSIGRPAAIKIRGEGSKLEGSLKVENNLATGKIIFDLESLDTNINLRNRHMKEKYLETNKYKNAELTIEKLKIPDQAFLNNAETVMIPFDGVLFLHGVRRPVKGLSKIQIKKNTLTGTADFEVHLSDYNIETPSYLGVTVANDVQLSVNFLAEEKIVKK